MATQIDAAMWALYSWHGIRPGMRHARFWGSPSDRLSRLRVRLWDIALHRRRFDAFDLVPEQVLRFHRDLMSFRPRYIHGYPSLVEYFVSVAEQHGREGGDLGVEVVFLTGERLGVTTRENVEEYFSARVVNEYGCTESGLLAFDCEEGTSHQIPAAALAEVQPSSIPADVDASYSGRVLSTDLYGAHVPLLRYSLGDTGRFTPALRCACGRALPGLDISAGRTDSFIRLPSGRQVYDAILAYSMPREVLRFQAKQVSVSEIVVLMEVYSSTSISHVISECRRRLTDALGSDLNVRLSVVDHIPQDESGKLRYFIPLNDFETN